jgi:hypothetical protein
VTQAAESTRVRPALLPYLLASASLCTVAVAAATYASPSAALHAAAAGAVAAFIALPALGVGAAHGTNGILAAFVVGFFARMIAVAVGLVLVGARSGAALTYTAWFFALYVATQAVEVAYVWSSSRLSRRAGA